MCFIILSCDRHDDIQPKVISAEIVMGYYGNRLTKMYDTLIEGGHGSPISIDIDLDNDEVMDIRFTSSNTHSRGCGYYGRKAILTTLNQSFSISGYIEDDTIFKNIERYYSPYSEFITQVSEHSNYSCNHVGPNDSIATIQNSQFKVHPKYAGDTMTRSGLFESREIEMTRGSYQCLGGAWYNTSGDTVLVKFTNYLKDCSSFPLDIISYIGFKQMKDDQIMLGWIKLKIIDNYKILLFETSMQQ